MKNKSLVSIIMPLYNSEKYISESITNIELKQSEYLTDEINRVDRIFIKELNDLL